MKPAPQRPLLRAVAALLGLFSLNTLAADPTPSTDPLTTTAEIRTPPAPAMPRINGPRVYGARPGHPFFYHLPVTGERPVTFTAKGLPSGLTLDSNTGNITGTTADRGTHPVEFTTANARGIDKATIRFIIGDMICLTPPLGWNSWNHFSRRVTEADVRAAADAMVSSGLIDHGWTYVNIDDCWQGERDADGIIHGNAKFPDLKALGDYVHGKGLKYGVYSSPGPKTCAGFVGSYEHEDQDTRTYVEWGVDYVKYDRCFYGDIVRHNVEHRVAELLPPAQRSVFKTLDRESATLRSLAERTPEQETRLKEVNAQMLQLLVPMNAVGTTLEQEEELKPYRRFGQSLGKVPRDIIYSFCQYGFANVWEWGAALGGNSWRTTDDIRANWKSMTDIGFSQDRLAKFAGPGRWNDPDMLEIGNAGINPDECYTHMTLWCMLSAPLLIGCDMSKMDTFTVSLFSNDAVLAVDQDPLGVQGRRIKVDGLSEVWFKPLNNGEGAAVALFNRGEQAAEIGIGWEAFWAAMQQYRSRADWAGSFEPLLLDLWRNRMVTYQPQGVKMTVAPHGAELFISVSEPHF